MTQIWQGARMVVSGAVVGAVLSTAAAIGQDVKTDFDHTADFKQYRTFSFYKVQSDNPFFEKRIEDAITQDLTKRGMEMVATGGDLAITAIGETKDVQQYNTFYTGLGGGGFGWGGWGGWRGGGWGGPGQTTTTTQEIPVGTLLVDLYDTKSHQLVWRGRAHDELSSKPDKNTKKLNKAVDKMFDKYPPKTNG